MALSQDSCSGALPSVPDGRRHGPDEPHRLLPGQGDAIPTKPGPLTGDEWTEMPRALAPVAARAPPERASRSRGMDAPEPARGPAASAEALLRAGFVELVFHCPACGLGGTSLARPEALAERTCFDCGAPSIVTVLDRRSRG
jgi:hypothetical protein